MVEISENKEAAIVLGETVLAAATAYVAALPLPLEIKVPTTTLMGTVTAAILAFWKLKVNPARDAGS